MPLININSKNIVAVIGDSITFIGHYIDFMKEHLDKKYPQNKISFVNLGRSGETLSGLCEPNRPTPRGCLFERIDELRESLEIADAFIFCYGMNDGIYEPYTEGNMQAYQSGVKKLCNILHEYDKPILAVTPPAFDGESYYKWQSAQPAPDPNEPKYPDPYINYNDVLDKYSDWVLSRSGIIFDKAVDIHYRLNEYIKNNKAKTENYVYGDGIHPAKDGHYLMAKIILESLTGDKML